MLEEIESYVYENYIKPIVVEDNGVKKIQKEDLEKIKLSPHEKNFMLYIINKQKIKVTEEKITRKDRSPYVRDNNYGDIKTNELQKIDEPVMSKIEYSNVNDKIYEDYTKLDEYLETRFIPAYVILKQRKNDIGEIEKYPSISLYHIMALRLNEAELEHVMNYLNENHIRVGGKDASLDGEFDNYDYVNTYKESALPLNVSSNITLQKIIKYKQNYDMKLRDEIITDNIRLIPYVAYRYAIATNIDQHELESYGYEGLMLALDNFDVGYGCHFSTHAVAYIRRSILSGIQEILQGKKDNFYWDFVNAKIAVERENGLTLAEAPELVEDVIDLLIATGKIKGTEENKSYARMRINSIAIGNASLDDPEIVEELTTDGYLIDTHDYAEEALNNASKELVQQLFADLTPIEVDILKHRYGFYDGNPKSLGEISKIYGRSRERISQIEHKALRKIRWHYRTIAKLKDFYYDDETEKYGR